MVEYSLGSDALGLGREEWRPGGTDGCSSSGRYPRAFRSAVVKNFFISSARVVGEAPLIEVPLMMVTLSVFGWENMNCEALIALSSAWSVGSACRELTATNPDAGECGRERPLMPCWLLFLLLELLLVVIIKGAPFMSRHVGLLEPVGW